MSGQINFKSTTYHECGCIARATWHQGTGTPLDVAFSERYYPLEAYPRFDVMAHPTVDASKGGVLIHEVSHGMFSTFDFAAYDAVHSFAVNNPFDTYNNADTYRMFAEHEYLQ